MKSQNYITNTLSKIGQFYNCLFNNKPLRVNTKTGFDRNRR